MSEYVDPMVYPKAKYKQGDPASPALVNSPSEEKALGDGWVDNSDGVTAPPAEPPKKTPKADKLDAKVE